MAGFETNKMATSVTEEVDQLKSKYGEQCRVIKDVGEFAYVIQIKMKDYDLSIKFQVESSYPSTAPCVVVKSQSLGPELTEKLITTMNTQTKTIQSQTGPIMDGLFQHAMQWIEQQEIPVQPGVIPKSADRSKYQNKKKSKSGKRDQEQVVSTNKKKPPMKTATDVISRILWDESLPTDCFAVGYLDRFVGVVEKAFTAFSWEDIASVDYNTLAVPKHRIQYFKYKNMIVWDKNKRQDWVFGSDGNGKTIAEAMAEYENSQICTPISSPLDQKEDQDDDSDDDDIVISLSDSENVEVPQEPYWGAKMRPTHFLALKVTNPEVRKAVRQAQLSCTNLDAQYKECLIPPERLHVTLCCLGLDTTEQISDACQVLSKIQAELSSWDPSSIRLEFDGVDNFFHNCLYAKVKPNQRFIDFVNHLRICIAEAGVSIRDVFEYNPHLTLMKLSKALSHGIRTRYLDPRFYTVLDNVNFSSQLVDNIHLCVMSEVPLPSEFYRCPAVINFRNQSTDD